MIDNTFLRALVAALIKNKDSEAAQLLCDLLPSGSGIDSGTKVFSFGQMRLKLECNFHHMDDNGYYCGWSYHNVIVKADLSEYGGYSVRITGPDKRQIKEYLSDLFHDLFCAKVQNVNGKPILNYGA